MSDQGPGVFGRVYISMVLVSLAVPRFVTQTDKLLFGIPKYLRGINSPSTSWSRKRRESSSSIPNLESF